MRLSEIEIDIEDIDYQWIDDNICYATDRIGKRRGLVDDNDPAFDTIREDLQEDVRAIIRKHMEAAESEIRAMLRNA